MLDNPLRAAIKAPPSREPPLVSIRLFLTWWDISVQIWNMDLMSCEFLQFSAFSSNSKSGIHLLMSDLAPQTPITPFPFFSWRTLKGHFPPPCSDWHSVVQSKWGFGRTNIMTDYTKYASYWKIITGKIINLIIIILLESWACWLSWSCPLWLEEVSRTELDIMDVNKVWALEY